MSQIITVSDSNAAGLTLYHVGKYSTRTELAFKMNKIDPLNIVETLEYLRGNEGGEFVSTLTPTDFIDSVNKYLGV